MLQTIGHILKGWAQRFLKKKGAGHYVFQPSTHPMPLYPPTCFNPGWDHNLPAAQPNDNRCPVVYIVAPTQRSGTNFLSYLMNLHDDLAFPQGPDLPDEHFFFSYSLSLRTYCEKTVATWAKWSEGGEASLQQHTKQLMGYLGDGLLAYMRQFVTPGQRLLLKTPDAGNLNDVLHLFPQAKLLLLVRDGRDTVHSFTESWGGEVMFRKMCQRWAQRAREVSQFMEQAERSGRSDAYLLLRYDQLHADAEPQMRRILDFLGLDPERYDWAGLVNAPVLGSSTFRGNQEGINWQPVEKDESFRPTDKWKSWSKRKRRIFKKHAGQSLAELGFGGEEW